MELVIKIPEEMYKWVYDVNKFSNEYGTSDFIDLIKNGTPLPKYMKELKRTLLMEVDGGTDDRYLRYTDVCDRISNTIDTYSKAESDVQNADSD